MSILHLGQRLLFLRQSGPLSRVLPIQAGFLCGIYHLLLMNVLLLILWIWPASAVWVTLVALPALSLVLWVWLSQSIAAASPPLPWHDALIITKWTLLPVLGLLIISGVLLLWSAAGLALSSTSQTGFYFSFLSTVGLLFTGVPVLGFSLRHSLIHKHYA